LRVPLYFSAPFADEIDRRTHTHPRCLIRG
jgi:hypothetical protein